MKQKYLTLTLCIITIILSLAFLGINLLNSYNVIEQLNLIINTSLLTIIILLICLIFIKLKLYSILTSLTLGLFIIYLGSNILFSTSLISLPKQKLVRQLTSLSLNDAMSWANNNNIELVTIYEESDITPIYYVINQDIEPNTLLKNVSKIKITVSNGPNYDKEVIVPNMIGLELDIVEKFIKENFLNNVEFDFVESDATKNTVILQSHNGAMKRNSNIKWTFSIGSTADLIPLDIEDLSNKSLLDASLWLKKNGFKYEVNYEFSDEIARGYVISNANVGELKNPLTDTIVLTVSKGKKIIVPNLLEMSTTDITKWVIDNKLKITYFDKYDETTENGKVISSNMLENSEIEEGTMIEITTSKGALKMESFSSLNEFRSWADKYQVSYKESYEYSDLPSGSVISFSKNEGDIIATLEEITVKVSLGKAITIPSLIGLSRSSALSKCQSVGLKCSFISGGYNDAAKDNVIKQNKKAGIEVVSGTSLTLTLSLGPAKTVDVYIQPNWLGYSASASISSLKAKLSAAAPGANFVFVAKPSNSLAAGLIHESSPTKGGNNSFTQGNTYTFWIVE